ncbi:MAG: cupin domain-containing protein [Steroidobacteraceae bacterium]
MKSIAAPVDPLEVAANSHCGYPDPFRARCLPREKRALGDACGLTKIGVNHTTLAVGAASSMRHWHTHEDELVYVLEGELTLVTDAGEWALCAGQCAAFPAGHEDGHQLINRGTVPAVYLEISNRDDADLPHYPDVDLCWRASASGGGYFHKNGESY